MELIKMTTERTPNSGRWDNQNCMYPPAETTKKHKIYETRHLILDNKDSDP